MVDETMVTYVCDGFIDLFCDPRCGVGFEALVPGGIASVFEAFANVSLSVFHDDHGSLVCFFMTISSSLLSWSKVVRSSLVRFWNILLFGFASVSAFRVLSKYFSRSAFWFWAGPILTIS